MTATLALQWSEEPDDLDEQHISSTVGEDFVINFTISGTAVDVTGWDFETTISPSVDSSASKTWADDGDDPFSGRTSGGAFTLTGVVADTSELPARNYYLETRRVDSGFNTLLCKAFWTLSPSPYFTPVIPTPPGISFDLTDTINFLRHDGEWALPAGVNDTILALADTDWSANSIPVGTAADVCAMVVLTSNTILGRSSSGNVAAKSCTDFAFTLLDDSSAALALQTLGGGTAATGTGGVVLATSPTLAGTPLAPTAAGGTNTTQIATTAFVNTAVASATTSVADDATDISCFPVFNNSATGTFAPKSNAAFTFNAATVNLACTTFTGALVGNASTATSAATLTTPRAIYGNNFNGSADITGPATIATSTTTPLIIGGTTTTSTLTLQSSSHGSATTGADIVFKPGTTEAGRWLNSSTLQLTPAVGAAGLNVIGRDTLSAPVVSLRQSNGVTFGWDYDIEQVSTGNLYLYSVTGGVRAIHSTFSKSTASFGIGTLTPTASLHINAPDTTSKPAISLRTIVSNQAYGFDFDTETAAVGRLDLYGVVADSRGIALSVERDSPRRVSIGGTTFGAQLQVTAAASTVGLILKLNATPGDALQVNSSAGSGGDKFLLTGAGLLRVGTATDPWGAGVVFTTMGQTAADGKTAQALIGSQSTHKAALLISASDVAVYLQPTWASAVAIDMILGGITSGGTYRETLTLTSAGSITLADAANIAVNTGTGTQIATAVGQKLAFHGSAAVIQRAHANQAAAPTDAATSTLPFGYTEAQANAIVTLLNEIRAALVEKGLIKGAA